MIRWKRLDGAKLKKVSVTSQSSSLIMMCTVALWLFVSEKYQDGSDTAD